MKNNKIVEFSQIEDELSNLHSFWLFIEVFVRRVGKHYLDVLDGLMGEQKVDPLHKVTCLIRFLSI